MRNSPPSSTTTTALTTFSRHPTRRYLPNNTDSHKFYLELGALDGKDISNTWALEHTLGWTGILIEPGPVNFASLSKNRPNNILINAAICDKPQACCPAHVHSAAAAASETLSSHPALS